MRRGRIELFSTMGPCHSCRHVIRNFRADFPAVTPEVRYRNSTRQGGATAQTLKAGEGLYGMYGYDDATQPGGRNAPWRKIFPGAYRTWMVAEYKIRFKASSGQEQGPLAEGDQWAVAGTPHTPFTYSSPSTTRWPRCWTVSRRNCER
ncbi:deaminase domain-containing protein [Streptomyces sp. NPDC054841]